MILPLTPPRYLKGTNEDLPSINTNKEINRCWGSHAWSIAPCFLLGFGDQQHRKAVSPGVVPSMSVIPGLLLAGEGAQGRVSVHPLLSVPLGPLFISCGPEPMLFSFCPPVLSWSGKG